MISTVDPQARHAHKTVHRRQDGFKAHIAVEPDTGTITDCALTKAAPWAKASGSDNHEGVMGLGLLAGETRRVRVLGDSAYGTNEMRAGLADLKHVAVIKPIPLRPAVPGGFTIEDFTVDLTERTVVCPAGLTRTMTAAGNAIFGVACRDCALRAQCTTAVKGKTARISPHYQLQHTARTQSRKAK